MGVSRGIDRFISFGFYIFLIFFRSEGNADLTRAPVPSHTKPDNAEGSMCYRNQYFDMEDGRCVDIPGGGRVVHMYHIPQLCGPNNVGPYLLNPRYYYACKKDISILAECPDGQYYDQRLHKCMIMDKNSSSTFLALSEQVTDNRLQLPACEKIGLFAVKNQSDLFYSCESNGFQLFQTVYKCPTGTRFNAENQRCTDKLNPLESAVIKSRVPTENFGLQISNQFTTQSPPDAYSVPIPIPSGIGDVSETTTPSYTDAAIPSSILSNNEMVKARTGEQMGEISLIPAWQNAGIVVADASQPKSADSVSLLSQTTTIAPPTLTLESPYTAQVLTGFEDAMENSQGARSTEKGTSQNNSIITQTMDQVLDHLVTELTVFQGHELKGDAATKDIARTWNMAKGTTIQAGNLSARDPTRAQYGAVVNDAFPKTVDALHPADNVAKPPSGMFTWEELLNILSAAAHDIRRLHATTNLQPQYPNLNRQPLITIPTMSEYGVSQKPTQFINPPNDALTNDIVSDITKSIVTELSEKQN